MRSFKKLVEDFAYLEELVWLLLGRLGPGQPSFPLLSATFVDPQNSTGRASDSGPGTLAQPLLTVRELNRRLVQEPLSDNVTYTITFLSDATVDDVPIDTFAVQGYNIGLIFAGTPTVLRTGVLTGGTVPMDPTAAGGGQATTLDDTTIGAGGWVPFEGLLLRVTSGARAGVSCWISHGDAGTTAVGSAPFLDTNLVAGPQSGDPYEIVQGTIVQIGNVSAAQMSGEPFIEFDDIDSSTGGISGYIEPGNATVVGVRTKLTVFQGGSTPLELGNCWADATIVATSLSMSGGVYSPSLPGGQSVGNLLLDAHTLVRTAMIVANFGVGVRSLGVNVGVQFQNCPGDAFTISTTINLSLASGRVWGKNNGGGGNACVLVHAGSSCAIAVPTVTGGGNDWNLATGSAWAWDTTAHVYTAAIATRTWAALAASTGSGGFGSGAHDLTADAHLRVGVA